MRWTVIFISLWRLVSLCERTVGVGIYACDDGDDGLLACMCSRLGGLRTCVQKSNLGHV